MIYYLQHILSAGCYTSLRCTVLHVSVIFTEKFSRIILLQLIKRILQKVGDQGPTQSLCAHPAYSFFLMKWNYWLPLKQYSNISRFYKLIWYVYANLNHFFLLFRCQKLRESKDVKCTECGVRSNLAYCFECGWVQDFTIAVIHEFPETEQLSGTAICCSLSRRGYNNVLG